MSLNSLFGLARLAASAGGSPGGGTPGGGGGDAPAAPTLSDDLSASTCSPNYVDLTGAMPDATPAANPVDPFSSLRGSVTDRAGGRPVLGTRRGVR